MVASTTARSTEIESKFADRNETRPDPRICTINPETLPDNWATFCKARKVILHVAILYENGAETGKLWPATSILARGVNRGDHGSAHIAMDSTSGGYALAMAEALKDYLDIYPDFPIKRFIAVVPKSLPSGKRKALEEAGVELLDAPDAIAAMALAKEKAEQNGYWYTGQYWNPDNTAGYARVASAIIRQLPFLGMAAWGVGSGGGCSGVMPIFKERMVLKDRFACVAVVVEDGQKIGGVRDEHALEPGSLDWRTCLTDTRFVGEEAAYRFSAALWRQVKHTPKDHCYGGPSTGFAAEGAMLALRRLYTMRRLDELRAFDGYVHALIPSLDRREPYASEYGQRGIYFG